MTRTQFILSLTAPIAGLLLANKIVGEKKQELLLNYVGEDLISTKGYLITENGNLEVGYADKVSVNSFTKEIFINGKHTNKYIPKDNILTVK